MTETWIKVEPELFELKIVGPRHEAADAILLGAISDMDAYLPKGKDGE